MTAGFGALELLGWTADALALVEHLRGWTEPALERLELAWLADERRVGIPIRDELGAELGLLRYDPTGERSPKMLAPAGVPRALFPPPELIADAELDQLRTVWLVEGEPDAIRLWSLGLPAIGVPGGGNWRDEWAARFTGRRWRVIVCFDCDHAGRQGALRAATAIVRAGGDARIVDLAPDRDDGYDFTDFTRSADTAALREQAAAALQAIADRIELYRPEPGEAEPGASPGERPWHAQPWPAFRDETGNEYRWLVRGLIAEGMLVFIGGPPKKGKTWLGLALAIAVATGRPLFGEYEVPEPRNVIYVALEGARVGIRARIAALARGLDLDPDGGDLDRLHVLYRPRPFDLVELETQTWLVEQAAEVDAALVLIDVLRAAARFKENEASEFLRVRDALEPLLAAGRSVPVLHHFGKLTETQEERSPGERLVGTGAIYGALDVGLLITKSESGARRLRVEIEARDFASPDAIGVVIGGTGSGEHGGFTYADTATVELDPTAAEDRDLADELEQHFAAHGKWLTETELSSKENGIGANRGEVKAALAGAPDRFAQVVAGRRVGRGATAKPWGSIRMLRELEAAEVAQASEQPEQPRAAQLDSLLVEQVAPLSGSEPEQPAQQNQRSLLGEPSNLAEDEPEQVDV